MDHLSFPYKVRGESSSLPYDDWSKKFVETIVWLNHLANVDRLGNVNNVFTQANNYGLTQGTLNQSTLRA